MSAETVRCRYTGHRYSHCDCPWWRRWWFKDRSRPIPPGVSGTMVMPKVVLPEGFEPPSAAVITPPPVRQIDGGAGCSREAE